ncbi:MAG: hypothetical protein ACOCPZ_02700 [Natrialbaceae archaeon]
MYTRVIFTCIATDTHGLVATLDVVAAGTTVSTGSPAPGEGCVGVTGGSEVTRANLLAQMASDPSVTTDVLADTERQFPDGRLAGDPPVAYLAESESPAYVLTNEKKGIGLGTKRNTVSPDRDRGTVIVVTARRTLCLVGSEAGDETFTIPHSAVAWVSSHTGLFANRLELRTPAKAYHCWAERATGEAQLEAATEFVDERITDDPTPIAGDDEASVVNWRGGTVTSGAGGHDGDPDDRPGE